MVDNKKCFVCGSNASVQLVMDPVKYFYDCPVCGRYEYYVMFAELTEFNLNHLGAYLAYNGFKHNFNEYRYFTTMSKEQCDEYKKEFKNGNISHGHPVRLENENVENWYPKSFAEKVDYILLYLNSKNPYWGESIILEKEEMISCLFVDRYELKNGKWERRADEALLNQAYYMLRCLAEQKFIELPGTWNGSEYNRPIILTPTGYARIDMLQKNSSNGKNVLVAMKFGEDTKILREAIRQGIHEDLVDFFALKGGKLGRGILNNSKTKIILNMEPSEAENIRKELDLSEAEAMSIARFERGTGLISTNSNNLIVDFKASQLEKDLITTDRKDLQELKERLQKYGRQAYGKQAI